MLVGCVGKTPNVDLADVADLASDALLGALLGTPPERVAMLMGKPEPPLLEKGIYETVLLATDTAGFARASKGALSEEDLNAVEANVVKQVGKYLKKLEFRINPTPFPPEGEPVKQPKTLLATFTPETEEGGSPDDKRKGNAKTYVLIRLTITDPQTRAVLRVRDFYSGRDVASTERQFQFRERNRRSRELSFR